MHFLSGTAAFMDYEDRTVALNLTLFHILFKFFLAYGL